jgi:hypothetical protein
MRDLPPLIGLLFLAVAFIITNTYCDDRPTPPTERTLVEAGAVNG